MPVIVKPLVDAGFGAKGLKKWSTYDGGGYQYTLTHDRKAVAMVTNGGHGGPVEIEWKPDMDVAKARLAEVVASIPPIESYGRMLTVNDEFLMEELVNHTDLVKVCKKKTAFRTPEDSERSYKVINAPFDAEVREYVISKWPKAIILNENLFA